MVDIDNMTNLMEDGQERYRNYLMERMVCYSRTRERLMQDLRTDQRYYADEHGPLIEISILLKWIDYGVFDVFRELKMYTVKLDT